MAELQDFISDLKGRFNASAAQGMDIIFQFSIENGDDMYAAITDGQLDIQQGQHDEPTVTLIMSDETFQGVIAGEVDGMQAFMGGQLRAEGDMMQAMKLNQLFNFG